VDLHYRSTTRLHGVHKKELYVTPWERYIFLNPLKQASSSFYATKAPSTKFGLHAGNMCLTKQNEERIGKRVLIYNLTCLFFIAYVIIIIIIC